MALNTAEDVKKELEKVVKYSDDDAEKAIAAGVLSLMLDMRNLYVHVAKIKDHLKVQ